jgi:hypothetical protein
VAGHPFVHLDMLLLGVESEFDGPTKEVEVNVPGGERPENIHAYAPKLGVKVEDWAAHFGQLLIKTKAKVVVPTKPTVPSALRWRIPSEDASARGLANPLHAVAVGAAHLDILN